MLNIIKYDIIYEYLCRNALTEFKKNVCMVIDQFTLNPVSFLAVSTRTQSHDQPRDTVINVKHDQLSIFSKPKMNFYQLVGLKVMILKMCKLVLFLHLHVPSYDAVLEGLGGQP